LSLLDLPQSVQARVEGGQLAATVAADIASKIDDPEEQEEVAAEVVDREMTRAEAKAAVRERVASKPKAGGSKGRGATKNKPKLPDDRTLKTSVGLKVTVTARKGFDLLTLLAALEESATTVREEIEAGGD
jgi:ParB-like chromosome segregation protein Spo0J